MVLNAAVGKQMNRWCRVCQSIVLRAWMQVIEAYQRWMKYCMCYASQGLQYSSVNISFAPDKHCLPYAALFSSVVLTFQNLLLPHQLQPLSKGVNKKRGKVYVCVFVCVCVCVAGGVAHVCVWKREGSGSWHSMRRELSPHLIEIDCHMSEFRSDTESDCQLLFSHPLNWITVSKSRTETGFAFACSPLGY